MQRLFRLPRIMRYLSTTLCGLSLFAAITMCALIVLPAPSFMRSGEVSIGSVPFDMPRNLPQLAGDKVNPNILISNVRGDVVWRMADNSQTAHVLRHLILPVGLMEILVLALVFDLFRRLFRLVERGDCFSEKTIRLVRGLGGILIGYSLVQAVADSWVSAQMIDIFRTQISPAHNIRFMIGDGSPPFDCTFFLAGLIVLALSEVFRQGLILKRENDLTI